MVEQSVTLKNPSGLHARPAAQFVQAAGKFKGTTVKLIKEGREADSKSILAVLGLAAKHGHELTIRAEGPAETEAVETLVALIESGFGEV